jgi:hypothetical protein
MRSTSFILIASLLSLLGCGEDLRYNESAPTVRTKLQIRAYSEPSELGGIYPVLKIAVENGGDRSFEHVCPRLFGDKHCGLTDETNELHAGDQIRVTVEEWACVRNCTLFSHRFTIPERGIAEENLKILGGNVSVRLEVTPQTQKVAAKGEVK